LLLLSLAVYNVLLLILSWLLGHYRCAKLDLGL
jgi:hypothetical protein